MKLHLASSANLIHKLYIETAMPKHQPRTRNHHHVYHTTNFRLKLFKEASTVLDAFIENYANAKHYTTALVLVFTLIDIADHHEAMLVAHGTMSPEYVKMAKTASLGKETRRALLAMHRRFDATGDWFLTNDDQLLLESSFSALIVMADVVPNHEMAEAYRKAAAKRMQMLN
jgi:hypothetical protein